MNYHDSNSPKAIWITWENQVRNKTLSKEISAQLYQLESKKSRLIRYIHLSILTFSLIKKTSANVVVVQNPSIILALIANVFCRLYRKQLAVDAHNGGLFPIDGKYWALNKLAQLIVKVTPLTIVSNMELQKYVEGEGGQAIVVPDPLPDIVPITKHTNQQPYKAVFVCTWASDEPYLEVIEAAKRLPDDITLYITGNHKGKVSIPKQANPNIVLTGYISDEEYASLLSCADVTIDLTTRDNCLVCGAYESVALEKPMILSDKLALKSYFNKGALYTENNAEDIAKKIIESRRINSQLQDEVRELKKQKTIDWPSVKHGLLHALGLCN